MKDDWEPLLSALALVVWAVLALVVMASHLPSSSVDGTVMGGTNTHSAVTTHSG